MSPWKAATSREECCTFLQRRFRMNCSEVYPVLLPCFSSSLLASSYWHHQLLTLREAYPDHYSTTQSQVFHLSHSSPAPSSLWCAILPWVSQQPPTYFPLTLCVLKGHILPLIFFWPLCHLPSPLLTAICHTRVTSALPGTFFPSNAGCLLVLPYQSSSLDLKGLSGRTSLWPVRLSLQTLLFNLKIQIKSLATQTRRSFHFQEPLPSR